MRSFPIPWTILRPALVYGPGSSTLAWMRRLTLGAPLLPVPVFAGATRVSPIWVEDLAAAIEALAQPGDFEIRGGTGLNRCRRDRLDCDARERHRAAY